MQTNIVNVFSLETGKLALDRVTRRVSDTAQLKRISLSVAAVRMYHILEHKAFNAILIPTSYDCNKHRANFSIFDHLKNQLPLRYEKGSIIITTNKDFEHWGDIFSYQILSQAIQDRLVHYATTFKINGTSFRTQRFKNNVEKNRED